MFRFIDEINKVNASDEQIAKIRSSIRYLKMQPDSLQNRKAIKKHYHALDELLFRTDLINIVVNTNKDYIRACKGFTVNGIPYVRLLATNGGVKNKTIIFVSQHLAPELRRRIDNGRNPSIQLVPAKLEAYRALTCSVSKPVSMPKGVLIVKDCEVQIHSEAIVLDDEGSEEPSMEYHCGLNLPLVDSDGYGLMLTELAERWSKDLGLGYTSCGFNTRFAWEKGMVFTFDFIEFADKVAQSYMVTDAWGNKVDIRKVELILTTSMVKLWDSYDSCEHYLSCSANNQYTFAITKACPKKLESERNLNYQFIQSYELTDEDIERLIQPTIDEINDIILFDRGKAILYLAGTNLDEKKIERLPDNFIKAIMIDERMLHDPYVRSKIWFLINKRIQNAKVGVLKVHGNYSVVSGDPYALCQSIFGLKITGLLSSGEIYNKYWVEKGASEVICFRAPMTCHNNIRRLKINDREETAFWYRYLEACTVLNAKDTVTYACNGMDKDGDLILLTDNDILLRNTRDLPAILCKQRKAAKKLVSEELLMLSNMNSFGDDIGRITNRITSMYELQSHHNKESPEYEALAYRIQCGQLYQQNAIDKAKGIVARPMPKAWYSRRDAYYSENRSMNLSIVADRKPYFMRYIYPDLMRKYNQYIKNTAKKCLREFRITIEELFNSPVEQLSEEEKDFIHFYKIKIPLGVGPCVMNSICRKVEQSFDGLLAKRNKDSYFNYYIMKSGKPYNSTQFYAVKQLYNRYLAEVQSFMLFAKAERIDMAEENIIHNIMIEEFRKECLSKCSDAKMLCDIVLDLCYAKNGSKQFAWDICGSEIIDNLLINTGNSISYPTAEEAGDISFSGEQFAMITIDMSGGNIP